ncbi:MAG: hypothetical protein EBV05_08015 [Cyanobacteria bacterium WB6_1B_304]|nr:hypothetical protein [Cyanobacteria bacterium WB6_1B_304]
MKTNALSRIITSFTIYKFLDALTTPFTRTAAYSKGIIDAQGIQIKPDDQLTAQDKLVYTDFDRLVFSLRRLILMVPDPYVRKNMTNVMSVLNLISEECEQLGGDREYFQEMALREMEACRLLEDMGSGAGNAMGGSFSVTNVESGLSNPPGNLAGYDPPLATGKKIFRRRKPNKYYTDKNNSY